MLAVDQAADQRDLAKGALQQMGALHPFDELMLQYVRRKERAGIDNRLHRPRAKRRIGGDENQWAIARRLHAASEEHAEDRTSTRMNSRHKCASRMPATD